MFKQLSKIKRVAESAAFKEFQESKNLSTSGPKSMAEANVLARLFKSNPVKNVMPGILADIRKLLGLEEIPSGKQGKADDKDVPAKEKVVRRVDEESRPEPEGDEPPVKQSSNQQHDEQDSDVEEEAAISGNDGSDGEDFLQFDSRLAPGSDSEDMEDEEARSYDDLHGNKKTIADDISDSISRSPSPAFSPEVSPEPKKNKASKASAAPAQSTTFLPSLMMGGYWSGSEEASEDEAAGPPKRKNRMGQQARRALWEKKYGAKANHVQQEQKKQKRNRDSGWDTRRGATDGAWRGGKGAGRGGFGAGESRPQNRRDDRAGASQSGKPHGPPKDTGPLHPSWEAKRKLKEQASTAAFQGKKVVFD